MNAPIPVAPVLPPEAPAPCLLINRLSFRASRGDLAQQAAALAEDHGCQVIQAEAPADFIRALDALIARGTRRLFVLAGDGTVQAVAQHLASRPVGTRLPDVLLLAGGRTNLVAADMGRPMPALQALQAALARKTDVVEERAVLTIEQAPAPPRSGFFVAAAMIDSAIRYCHHRRHSGRGSGHSATHWSLCKLALLTLLGRSPLPPDPVMSLQTQGLGELHGATRVLIATTLEHRRGLLNPYAARGQGPLRVTAVASGVPFWRRLPRILLGRFSARWDLSQGYLSGRCDGLTVTGLGGYTLDGESFDCDPERPVRFRAGPRLRFIQP